MKTDVSIDSIISSRRRDLFVNLVAKSGASGALGLVAFKSSPANSFYVPDLPYKFDALEPYLDKQTMRLHHNQHHAIYVSNLNKAFNGMQQPPIVDVMKNALDAGPTIRNNGGGHYNHAFFWNEIIPPGDSKKTHISKKLETAINEAFGSLDGMKEQFEARAAPGALFGSGWVWVVANTNGKLKIVCTPNQDNPLMKGVLDSIYFPILGLDVWEHAYYLQYQNRRPEYVSAWWNVVDWNKISDNYDVVLKTRAGVSVEG